MMKHTDSYCNLLPPEIKKFILKYKESQELIEWCESTSSRNLCNQIRLYERMRQRWFIGPIRCRSFCTRVCGNEYIDMRVYGNNWDLSGVKKQVFLHYRLGGAMALCHFIKLGLQ